LHEPNFEVYEDGKRQSIRVFKHEDLPVTVGLVVDHSGSMRPKLGDVIAAARMFVQLSSPADEMFVVNFNEHVTLGLPAGMPLSNQPEELARAISHEPASGQTALYDAVFKAREQLQVGSREKKVLIVISDGGDNASGHRLAEVLKLADQSDIQIYVIGIYDDEDADKNPEVLRQLAQKTGGEASFPRHLSEVVAICERIARDIRSQYTIGYFSTKAAQSGAHHSIRVVARDAEKSKLVVRTRSGYSERAK
jgi:VWFA-related protein